MCADINTSHAACLRQGLPHPSEHAQPPQHTSAPCASCKHSTSRVQTCLARVRMKDIGMKDSWAGLIRSEERPRKIEDTVFIIIKTLPWDSPEVYAPVAFL